MLPQDTDGTIIVVSVVVLAGFDRYSNVHQRASGDSYVDCVAVDSAFSV
jgi:hypothetical protein